VLEDGKLLASVRDIVLGVGPGRLERRKNNMLTDLKVQIDMDVFIT
jgi:hypothetical protein